MSDQLIADTPATTLTAAPETPGIPQRRGLILATILIAQLMVVLDMSIVNVALPAMQGALGFTPTGLSWVLNGYSLAFGGLLLLGARTGDLLGRRPTFLAGIALFTLASLAGGFATTGAALVVSRVVQGIGAAFAAPASLSLLTTMFPEGRERVRALGLYTAVSVGGVSFGLVVGGILTEYASWRWVMLVNVPIGILVAAIAWLAVPHTPRRHGRFDLAGAVTSTAGVSALVYGFVHAASAGWGDPVTLTSVLGGVALLVAFVAVERRADEPITPLGLFANRVRSGALLARMFLIAGAMGAFFFLTQYLQDVLGFSPVQAGLAFLPMTAGVFVASQASSRVLVERFGERAVMITGAALTLASLVWLTRLDLHSGYADVLVALVLLGLGNGLAFVPLTASALHDVAPGEAGAASGLVNVAQQLGSALGLAGLVTVSGHASRAVDLAPALDQVARAHQTFLSGAHAAFEAATLMLVVTLALVTFVIRRPEEG
ncbi:MFS transporter [Marmoricola sp. RAF53]|uniref:MFS transporter n=1 Tax=Marmoricola sp. RAF53 TaxID=3233059 RepID=UPI003F971D68